MDKVIYNRRTWLNKESSCSTGNIIAVVVEEDDDITALLSIADCYNSARLHKTKDDSMEDFIDKMKTLNTEIVLFIEFLEKQL